jgi:hypothetical protein
MVLFMVGAGMLALAAPPAAAGTTALLSTELPGPRFNPAAFFDATQTGDCPQGCAYALGGRVQDFSNTDDIVRFDPSSGAAVTLGEGMLFSSVGHSVAWDGTTAYLFGLYDGGLHDSIVRYTPSMHAVALASAKLPTGRSHTSSVWDARDRPAAGCPGGCAYVFGGYDGARLAQIVRYNPTLDKVTVMGAQFPTGRYATSAVWAGTTALILGGYDGGPSLFPALVYDPIADTLTVKSGAMPVTSFVAPAVWHDGEGVLFTSQMLHYDLASNVWESEPPSISGLEGAGAALAGGSAYLFGGYDGSGASARIARYDFAPLVPSTTATLTGVPGENGWYRSDVRVTLQCPGCTMTTYALDGGAEERYRSPIDIDAEGDHVVRFSSTGFHLTEAMQEVRFRIDKTAPDAAVVRPGNGDIATPAGNVHAYLLVEGILAITSPVTVAAGDVEVVLRVADALSGPGRAEFLVDGEIQADDTVGALGYYRFTWHAGQEALGTHELAARGFDAAGNDAPLASLAVTTVPLSLAGAEETAAHPPTSPSTPGR